jgi:hypothetical protein
MPQAVAEIEQMGAVIARQRLAVLAEVGDVVEAGREPRILRNSSTAYLSMPASISAASCGVSGCRKSTPETSPKKCR